MIVYILRFIDEWRFFVDKSRREGYVFTPRFFEGFQNVSIFRGVEFIDFYQDWLILSASIFRWFGCDFSKNRGGFNFVIFLVADWPYLLGAGLWIAECGGWIFGMFDFVWFCMIFYASIFRRFCAGSRKIEACFLSFYASKNREVRTFRLLDFSIIFLWFLEKSRREQKYIDFLRNFAIWICKIVKNLTK